MARGRGQGRPLKTQRPCVPFLGGGLNSLGEWTSYSLGRGQCLVESGPRQLQGEGGFQRWMLGITVNGEMYDRMAEDRWGQRPSLFRERYFKANCCSIASSSLEFLRLTRLASILQWSFYLSLMVSGIKFGHQLSVCSPVSALKGSCWNRSV